MCYLAVWLLYLSDPVRSCRDYCTFLEQIWTVMQLHRIADITYQFHLKITKCQQVENRDRKQMKTTDDSDLYLLRTESQVSSSLGYWDDELSSTKCLSTHYAGAKKTVVTRVLWRMPNSFHCHCAATSVCCCEANLRHPEVQLAQNEAGHTDYWLKKFPYSQQNILVASRRKTLKTNTWKQFLFSAVISFHFHTVHSSRQKWLCHQVGSVLWPMFKMTLRSSHLSSQTFGDML